MNFIHTITSKIYYALLSLSCLAWPEKTSNIDVNGVNLLYAMRGPKDGYPVVVLHGNGGSHIKMRTQAMQLAKAGYMVYSLDSRGQGANAPLDEYHYADMAEDTYQFIQQMGLEKPYIYGWSDGGIIALMLEMAHPGTCGKIAISGANITPDCGEGFEEFKAWILEKGTPLLTMMLDEPNIDPKDLNAIKCPTLVTAGSEDMISVEHTKLIADNIPDSQLVILQGKDHGNYIKRSPIMGRLLLKFYCK